MLCAALDWKVTFKGRQSERQASKSAVGWPRPTSATSKKCCDSTRNRCAISSRGASFGEARAHTGKHFHDGTGDKLTAKLTAVLTASQVGERPLERGQFHLEHLCC